MTAKPPSASADHRWAPKVPRFIRLSSTVAPRSKCQLGNRSIVAQLHNGPCAVYCAVCVSDGLAVIERAVISQSLLIMDMGRPADAI